MVGSPEMNSGTLKRSLKQALAEYDQILPHITIVIIKNFSCKVHGKRLSFHGSKIGLQSGRSGHNPDKKARWKRE